MGKHRSHHKTSSSKKNKKTPQPEASSSKSKKSPQPLASLKEDIINLEEFCGWGHDHSKCIEEREAAKMMPKFSAEELISQLKDELSIDGRIPITLSHGIEVPELPECDVWEIFNMMEDFDAQV